MNGLYIMPVSTYHTYLRLQNFTVYKDASFEFVSGINSFIGKNGTGKTHVMKAMYAYQVTNSRIGGPSFIDDKFQVKTQKDEAYPLLGRVIAECFHPTNGLIVRRNSMEPGSITKIEGKYDHQDWVFTIKPLNGNAMTQGQLLQGYFLRPTFIPAADMMNHSEGFTAATNIVRLDFDRTCKDIVNLMSLERKEKSLDKDVLKQLASIMGGEIEKDDNDRFYIVNAAGKIPMPMAASGISRIATFARVYQNGWLPPGTTLFWDEPEISLNPPLMKTLVSILLALARSGVQIFLATHSYVILREIEVQANEDDSFRYFALSQSDNGVVVKPADSYLEIEPNEIESEYSDLYDRAIEKRLKRAQQ